MLPSLSQCSGRTSTAHLAEDYDHVVCKLLFTTARAPLIGKPNAVPNAVPAAEQI